MDFVGLFRTTLENGRIVFCNQGVSGSNPDGGTRFSNGDNGLGRCRRFGLVELNVISSCRHPFRC